MFTYKSLRQMTLFQFRTLVRNKIAFCFNLLLPPGFLLMFSFMFGEGALGFLLPGQLTFMLLNAGVTSVAIAVAVQRSNGSMRHMFTTPLTAGVWITSRLLASLLLAILQLITLFATAFGVFRVGPPANLLGTLVVLAFAALAALGIGLAIGVLARNPDAAQPISMLVAMALFFLGGAMFPLDNVAEIILTLSKLMPSAYMASALQAVMIQGEGVLAVLPDLAVLAACAAAGIGLAAWRIRKQFILSQ